MPNLVPEFEYRADLVLDDVGPGPLGQRVIVNVTGGSINGDRLKGTISGAGADWLLVGPDGFGRIDVRATFKTHDGAAIYVQYHGVVEVTEDMAAILGGASKSVGYGDQYFFTNPRLESGDYGPSSLVGTIQVDMGPAGVAVSPNGRYVYVVSQVQRPVVSVGPSDFLYGLLTYVGLPRRGGTLSVIDVKRMELDPTSSVVAHVAAGCGPVQVAASPDGSLVWVVAKRSNELLAFRSAQLATGGARPVARAPVGAAPDGLRLVRNGAVALVASSDHSQEPSTPQTVHVVDTAAALAGRPALRSAVAVGGMPQEIDLSPDQRTAYVANSGTSSLSTMDLSSVLGT